MRKKDNQPNKRRPQAMGARRATSPAYSLVSLIQTCTQYVRTVSLLPELRSTPTRSPGVQPKFCCAKAAVVGSRYIVELCSGSLLRRFLRSKTSNAESSLWLTTHGTPAQNVSPSVRYPTVSEYNLIKHKRTRVYHGKPTRQIPRGDRRPGGRCGDPGRDGRRRADVCRRARHHTRLG